VFEDSLHAVQTAKAAGFRTVGIYDAASESTQEELKKVSDVYVRSLKEVQAELL
jgi:beta-phosphoglucomutase-like phosphatase (HAD superfamily)